MIALVIALAASGALSIWAATRVPVRSARELRLPVVPLGPWPCGASRCECAKGGCDRLGAMSADAIASACACDEAADADRKGA